MEREHIMYLVYLHKKPFSSLTATSSIELVHTTICMPSAFLRFLEVIDILVDSLSSELMEERTTRFTIMTLTGVSDGVVSTALNFITGAE